jgi:GH18 family chitinase
VRCSDVQEARALADDDRTMNRVYFTPPLDHNTAFSAPLQAMYWNGVYYPNWRIYRDQPPVSLNFDVISHVFYAFAWYVVKDPNLPQC